MLQNILLVGCATITLGLHFGSPDNASTQLPIHLLLLLAIALTVTFERRASHQLKKLIFQAKNLSAGDLESVIDAGQTYEAGELARAFESIRRKQHEISDEISYQKVLTKSTLNAIDDAVIATNSGGVINYMNKAAEQQTGWLLSDVKGHAIENVFEVKNSHTLKQMSRITIVDAMSGSTESKQQMDLTNKSGESHPIEYRISPICTDEGRRVGAMLVFSDLSVESTLKTELDYQSSHDELTHLLNRREFERRVQQAITGARRLNLEHALCYLDLDQFKVINDTCGHMAGDELLRQIGQIIQSVVRTSDTISRLGGDEFGLLLEHCSTEQAQRVTAQLLEAIDEYRFVWESRSFAIGVSIGLVKIDDVTDSVTTALRDADSACFMAKELGRNRLYTFNEDDTQMIERRGEMQWIDKIDTALEQNSFVLYVQAIEPTAGNDTQQKHFEVLVRMRDENGQLVPPGLFLPAAERYGLVSKIDRWVVSNTLSWFSKHPDVISSLGLCSINLSGQSLGDVDFESFLIQQLEKSAVPAHCFCFEITETATIANLSHAISLIDKIKARGCAFALDDFGSGLSSFAYLKQLPVDFLKIDGLFVKDIMEDALDFAMVRSINEIGQLMGMQTIAEFVENDEIKERLNSLGVNFVQGYGVERPKPMDLLAA